MNSISSDTTVGTFSYTVGNGGFFDYYVVNSSGHARVGTVMVVWDASSTTYTDTSSPDLVGKTIDFSWDVANTSGIISLVAQPASGSWDIKVAVRLIY